MCVPIFLGVAKRRFAAFLLRYIQGTAPSRPVRRKLLALLRWFRAVSVSTISQRSDQYFQPIFPRARRKPTCCGGAAARGMESPFAIQELVIPEAIAGVDVLAKAPTGSGKTIAFAVPLVERTDPSRRRRRLSCSCRRGSSLSQVAGECAALPGPWACASPPSTAVHRSTPRPSEQKERTSSSPRPAGSRTSSSRMLTLSSIRTLVLDEADRMLDMGFKPQVERIVRSFRQTARRCSSRRRSTARSGTWLVRSRRTRRFESEGIPDRNEAEVEHRFESVTAEDKVERLIKELEAERVSRWCSSGRSAARTGSPSAWPVTTWRPSRCTAT